MIDSLADIPSEIVYNILLYLDVKDILQTLSCCTDFYEQFATDTRLWNILCLRDYGIQPEFTTHSKRFYQNLLFPYRNLIISSFRCGSIIVEANITSKGIFGFYYVWAPDAVKNEFFKITMDMNGRVSRLCCLNSGDLDEVSEQESAIKWGDSHHDNLSHECSVEVYLSGLAPQRNTMWSVYHVLKFVCTKGLVYRFKIMGVKGAFSGNTHSF